MQIMIDHPESRPRECIFIIEADEVVRSALCFILEQDRTVHAFTGIDGALASAVNLRPAVVLLGIGLLQEDGAAVVADLTARIPETRLLLVANSTRDCLALAARAWGVHEVLGKPITYEAVRYKVDALLGALPTVCSSAVRNPADKPLHRGRATISTSHEGYPS